MMTTREIVSQEDNEMPSHDAAKPLNRLKALWREGKTTLGLIATIPSVQTVREVTLRSLPVANTPPAYPCGHETKYSQDAGIRPERE